MYTCSECGDPLAFAELASDARLCAKCSLPERRTAALRCKPPLSKGQGWRLDIVPDARNRLRVSIVIDPDATHDSLREAIAPALQWCDRLHEPPDGFAADDAWLLLFSEIQRRSHGSYAQLAARFNAAISEMVSTGTAALLDAISAWVTVHRREPSPDVLPSLPAQAYDNLVLALVALETLRVPRDEIKALLTEAMTRALSREPPFETDYPLSKEKVRSTLRTWRKAAPIAQLPNDELYAAFAAALRTIARGEAPAGGENPTD